mmetsp:Transcript_57653/g.165336  ORF Transcript_57653/g.165336 Transcript_57653/m.165336 type:complete len:279 (-) Transcript_57653:81-917(-)
MTTIRLFALFTVLIAASASVTSAIVTGAGAPVKAEAPEAAAADAAVAAAAAAAKKAWAAEAKVKQFAAANAKYVPLVEAEVDVAKAAAEAAAESEQKANQILADTRAAAKDAAIAAAMDYFAQVKAAGSEATNAALSVQAAGSEGVKVEASRAAATAAKPYNAMLLRGQRVVYDYVTHSQALAAAGNHLQAEAMTLASSAEQYQMIGQVAQANQIMMTAHSLLSQGDRMRKEALDLRRKVADVQAALPLYQQAEQAAVASAAQQASIAEMELPPPAVY